MTARTKTKLALVQPDLDQLEAVVIEAASQTAPMVQRRATHLDRINAERISLERERADLVGRRDLLRRQVEAVEIGIAMHIEDIDATLSLYSAAAE